MQRKFKNWDGHNNSNIMDKEQKLLNRQQSWFTELSDDPHASGIDNDGGMWVTCLPCSKGNPGQQKKMIASRRKYATCRWAQHKDTVSHLQCCVEKDGQTSISAFFPLRRKASETDLPRDPIAPGHPRAPKMCEGIMPRGKTRNDPIFDHLSYFSRYGVFPAGSKVVIADFNGTLQLFPPNVVLE
jgi:hypothetical protein